ncbi:hypothetical protein [Actinopolymorpha alba]|uniref:ATP-dependent DNA ligase n=1 Tax=Actinopolymorpha alba TaxID=533267 RepID=UPI00058F2925|nr:hypothetical protein [Actinopolymorpha alba]
MLARSIDHLPAPGSCPGGCLYEPKWDGFRAISIVTDQGDTRIASRRGTDLTGAFPEIVGTLFAVVPKGSCLDGEVVCWTRGKLDFSALQLRYARRARARDLAKVEPCHLVVFDVLELDGCDYRREPLTARRRVLETLLHRVRPGTPLALGMQTSDLAVAEGWYNDLAVVGVEGLVIKPARSRYEEGRRLWWKYKARVTTEAITGGVTGTLRRPQSLILGRYDSETGRLRVAGSTTRLSDREAAEIAAELTPAGGRHPWPEELNIGWRGPVRYVRVEPTVVVEISADIATDRGRRWRHAVRLLRIRDMPVEDVPLDLDVETREQP